MHMNTPHIGKWSLRTPDTGEYVTDLSAIFALASCNSETLKNFRLKIAGVTDVEDVHDEDPRKLITTSSVIHVQSLDHGFIGFTTDRLHEYICDLSDMDPKWQQAINQATAAKIALEERADTIRLRVIEPRQVKEVEVEKKTSRKKSAKAVNL